MKYATLLLICAALLLPGSAPAQVDGTWGMGVMGAYDLPVLGLSDWYSGGVKFGASALYVNNKRWTTEVEVNYSKYNNGELENKTFLWSIDKREYPSPQAKSEMKWLSGEMFWLRHFKESKLGESGSSPYALFGAGFSRYHNDISGMIYPAQKKEPLDNNALLKPVRDRRVAVSASIGGGVEFFTSSSMAIDARAQYRLVFGSTRPMEAWGLAEAWPFSKIDLALRLKFYFLK
jgi:hypothetical protein